MTDASTAKTAAADVVTQRFLEGSERIDVRRVGVFTVFGFWYLGAFQYFLYVRCFRRWFCRCRATVSISAAEVRRRA